LINTNENTTIAKAKNFRELNKPGVNVNELGEAENASSDGD
jgi:hypothetical protein